MKTFDELTTAVLAIIPTATFDEDMDGQLVIYTDLAVDENDNVVAFEAPA